MSQLSSKNKQQPWPLGLRLVCWISILVLALGAGIVIKTLYEKSKMDPLPTGLVDEEDPQLSGVYAINNGTFVNCYLVAAPEGGYLMIDAGNTAKYTDAAMRGLGITPKEVKAVLLTHSDIDHVTAVSLFTDIPVYLSDLEAPLLDGTLRRSIAGYNSLTADYTTLEDEQVLEIAGLTVRAISTPGHTPGSMSYLIDGRLLFVGDSLSLRKERVGLFNSFYNVDDAVQAQSIERLRTVEADYLFTGHYGYTADPAGAFAAWPAQ